MGTILEKTGAAHTMANAIVRAARKAALTDFTAPPVPLGGFLLERRRF